MSNETKWTPGPWVIDPETRPAEICSIHGMPRDHRTNQQGWAYVRGALGYWAADEEEEMANANLIAAAPELYELAVLCIDWIDSAHNDAALPTMPGFDRDWAEEVIAKARGEQ